MFLRGDEQESYIIWNEIIQVLVTTMVWKVVTSRDMLMKILW